MAKRRKKAEHDAAVTAYKVFQQAIGESDEAEEESAATKRGKARAVKLTPERRSEIARRAAKARWAKAKRSDQA